MRTVVGEVLLTAVLLVSFVLFNAGSLSQAAGDFRCLFGLGGLPLCGKETGYYLASCAPLFLMGILGATPLPCRLGQRLEKTRVGGLLEAGLMTGLLLVCTGYLVDGSFSPFLYFRF